MAGHHLILGEISDFLTGKVIQNTHDEQYRQKLARLLVNELGYQKADIQPRVSLKVTVDKKIAMVSVDFAVKLSDRFYMILKYGPGSLVTRHRSSLAVSRILAPYQIPLIVVTNGEDADILDGETGNVISSGLNTIPSKSNLLRMVDIKMARPISDKRLEMESRIIYAFEIDDSCPCDDTSSNCQR
ncbi:MAG: type I restriction enzyme HsdR N-terminal domain-containing protein [Deltaproteobacteria bacterium]|nr:type I restriction enzyme HsdR N-terminal domain-containing protein [Deltaproteobacteria bacterium]